MAAEAISESVKAKLQDKLRRKSEESLCARIKNVFETKFRQGSDLIMNEEQLESGKILLELKRRFADIVDVDNGGPLHSARAVIDEHGNATFQHQVHCVMKLAKEDGVVDEDSFKDLMEFFGPQYFFCVGMCHSEFDEISKNIHIILKNKEELKYPFHRIVSKKCLHWFKVGKNISKKQREKGATCGECKAFFRYTRRMKLKNERESAGSSRMQNRLKASSNFGISKLTPVSKQRRLLATTWKRADQQKKIQMYKQKLQELEVEMDENQNQEMEFIVQWINQNAVNDLESILAESENEGMADVVREKWLKDTEDRQTFYRDQFSNQGKTQSNGNRWSMITYRMALAIYIRSPAAYNALKSFQILQLPSTKSLQLFTSVRNHTPGVNEEYIEEKMQDYQAMCDEKVKNGFKKPLGVGILIFDEVKVIGKVMLNMKNEKFLGLAMSEDEMCSLHDIYKNLDSVEPVAAEYMLQYLWRDLTSDFDVIGPFYSFKATIDNTIVIETLLETMRSFHNYGFKTTSVVCDGASSNMAAIKLLTTGKRGAFGVSDDPMAKHHVEPWFENPFDSDLKVFCIICPSHQLKNMVNALFASRNGGTKAFQMEKSGPMFGWKAIVGMWKRECSRVEAGAMRMVPKLLPSYIQRDAWTKLNVAPAKIVQQDNVLTELYDYVHKGEGTDCVSTNLSGDYLAACNKIFERGILSNEKITINDMSIMQNILEGYTFFEDWWENLYNGGDFKPNDSAERRFISWQTWDLLRIVIFGFQGLVKSFLAQHPDYYIFPLKVNGSAVETLFSQFKFETNSKLNSVNYANARSRVLMKKDISGSAKAAHGYRDTPLYVKDKELKRKSKK
eukprot:gene6654-7400_t